MRVPYAWKNTFQNKKRTLAAVAGESGHLLAVAKDVGCNYQGMGRKRASEVLARVIRAVLEKASMDGVDSACYGIAGADRDKDFQVIREILQPIDLPNLSN